MTLMLRSLITRDIRLFQIRIQILRTKATKAGYLLKLHLILGLGILKRKSCNSELVIEIDFSNKKLWEKLSHNFTPNIFKVAENFKKTSEYSF